MVLFGGSKCFFREFEGAEVLMEGAEDAEMDEHCVDTLGWG
jgi:hypothetical protein